MPRIGNSVVGEYESYYDAEDNAMYLKSIDTGNIVAKYSCHIILDQDYIEVLECKETPASVIAHFINECAETYSDTCISNLSKKISTLEITINTIKHHKEQ